MPLRENRTLATLSPATVTAYLESRQWQRTELLGTKAAVWVSPPFAGQTTEILQPLAPLSDFTQRLWELLTDLAVVENRPFTEVYQDVIHCATDTLQIRFPGEEDPPTLEQTLMRLQAAHNLIGAVACSILRPKPYFSSHRPEPVKAFLAKVTLQQRFTEEANVTLSLPIVESAEEPSPTDLFTQTVANEEPFALRVLPLLFRAIATLQEGVATGQETIGPDQWAQWIPLGISANLCEAVIALSEQASKDVVFSMTGAATRVPRPEPLTPLTVPPQALPGIRELAYSLRQRPASTRPRPIRQNPNLPGL